MVATTANNLLPYPTGPDRPCDSWQTWQAFAETLDAKLVSLNGDLDRTARAVPLAKLSVAGATQLMDNPGDGYEQVVFNTVEVDTDNMADLALNPSVLVPSRAGYYHLHAYVTWDSVDQFAVPFAWINESGSVLTGQSLSEPNWAVMPTSAVINVITFAGTGTKPTWGISVTSAGVAGDYPRVRSASLTALWIADL